MRKVKLSDLCIESEIGKYGIPASAEAYDKNKVRYLRISDVDDLGNLINTDRKSISSDEIEKYILKEGEIVFARTGNSTGRTYFHEDKNGILAFAGFLIKFGLDKRKVNPKYLKYYTISDEYKSWVNNLSVGSTRGNINAQTFAGCPILLPERKQQDFLVKILSVIDDKIEVLHQINDNLAELAKTIYDYWFVQFDFPDENGKPYKSSGGKMVYNEVLKREIPEGWEVKRIGEFIDLERGVTYTKENISEKSFRNIGVLRATNISGNKIDLNNLVYISNKLKDSQILKQFDTLIVMSSGSKEHIGKNGIYYFSEQNAFGAFCAKIRAKEKMVFEFINVFLQSESFKIYIKNQCLGTNINNLNNTHILLCPILKPADNILELYHYNTKNIFQKIAYNTQQIQHLQSLRDWLLPMLMNGQISVE